MAPVPSSVALVSTLPERHGRILELVDFDLLRSTQCHRVDQIHELCPWDLSGNVW